VWEALKDDNAKALGEALDSLLDGKGTIGHQRATLLLRLERDLWNDGAGNGPLRSRRFGLIPVAAGHAQTPPSGALGCLQLLLRTFANDGSAWTDQQLDLALCMARKRHRCDAMRLLKCTIEGMECPERVGELWKPTPDDWGAIVGLLTRDEEIARISGLFGGTMCTNGNGDRGLFDGTVEDGKPVGPGTFTKVSGERESGVYTAQMQTPLLSLSKGTVRDIWY